MQFDERRSIDGVGMESNRAGLDGVLQTADEFCQFDTIWKAIVLAASTTQRSVLIELPKADLEAHAAFIKARDSRWVEFVAKEKNITAWRRVPAGRGAIILREEPQ